MDGSIQGQLLVLRVNMKTLGFIVIFTLLASTCLAYNHVEPEKPYEIGNVEWLSHQIHTIYYMELIEKRLKQLDEQIEDIEREMHEDQDEGK